MPTFGPLLVLSPALKHRGPPERQGLCSQSAHFWAIDGFEALGTPRQRGLCSQSTHLWAIDDIVPLLCIIRAPLIGSGIGVPVGGGGYVANLPTCGPLLVLSPTLKHCEPPRRHALMLAGVM